ncbi:MAG: hypothetical protein CME68_03160 [Halobacteriovoraceae bacterium]|nr:hypothetical protein [Halobacteriovoraceae bacterium]
MKSELGESKLEIRLKNQINQIEGRVESPKRSDLSNYDQIIKAVSITSYLMAVLTYFILFEIGYLTGY